MSSGTIVVPILRRVLVVDDDAGMRRALKRMLALAGMEAEEVSGAEEALACLKASPFDVLVTDFVMPELSGLALIEEARRTSPALQCVVISGQPREDGAPPDVAWLSKPLDIDELLNLIEVPMAPREVSAL